MPLEDFVLTEVIGRGSFGKVHKARHKGTGTIVAMKFIDKKGKKEKEIAGIRREIEILTALQHENIICMYDNFETAQEFVLVMEYARGELFDILEDDKSLPEPEVRSIAKQLVRALHYLHNNRIVHRDLKPQNILMGKNGVVKLCDFGFARTLSQQTIVLTSIKGTPLYMAPELVQEQPYNFSVDLWSLGCILYELYYSKPPFFTQNIYQLIDQIKKDPVKFPEPISPEFKSFLRGLLTKNAAQRLSWASGLMAHPFVVDSPDDARARALVSAQSRSVRQKLEMLGLIQVGRLFSDPESQQQQQAQQGINPRFAADEPTTTNSNLQNAQKAQQQQARQQQQQQQQENQHVVRLSLRNSVALRMESGFTKPVLDTVRNFETTATANPAALADALKAIEQSAFAVVLNPLHSSIFLTRINAADFFPKLAALICHTRSSIVNSSLNKNPHSPQILTRAVSLLRLFVHPEGASSITPFPSRALNDDAIALLKLRSECRIELTVRKMALIAIANNPQIIAVLLALAACNNIQQQQQQQQQQESVEIVGHALAILGQFGRCDKVDNDTDDDLLKAIKKNGPSAAALIARSPNFKKTLTPLLAVGNGGGSVFLPNVVGPGGGVADLFAAWRPAAVNFLASVSVFVDTCDIAAVIGGAVSSSSSSSLNRASPEHEVCYRSAICSLMKSVMENQERQQQQQTQQQQAQTQSTTSFLFGPSHLQYTLGLIHAVLGRTRSVVSSRPCGTMFSLPDTGLLDSAVWCIGAMYRAAAAATTTYSTTSVSVAPELTIPIQRSALFFDVDGGAFSYLLALLYAGSCDTTIPGFEISPRGLTTLLQAARTAVQFQLDNSPLRSVSCLLECAPKSMLPAPTTNTNDNNNININNNPATLAHQMQDQHDQQESAISLVLSVLASDWLQAIERWPTECGGGIDSGVQRIVPLVIDVLQYALPIAGQPQPQTAQQQQQQQQQTLRQTFDADDAARITATLQQLLLRGHCSERLFDGIEALDRPQRGPGFSLLTKLVTTTPSFVESFINSGGLQPSRIQSLLAIDSPCRGDALSILCHLSRSSKDVYTLIHDAAIFPSLLAIAQRDTNEVFRGRVCNLVGNLCKHNAQLYQSLKVSGLIAEMVNRCSSAVEPDDSARKFACFAVGNAAFHGDLLYPELGRAIPAVVELLKSSDDKARQNAAGALGNMARNSAALVGPLNASNSVEELVRCLGASDSSVGLKKIVVFSLGTLAQLDQCRQRIAVDVLQRALDSNAQSIAADVVFAKYVQRLKAKLPGL